MTKVKQLGKQLLSFKVCHITFFSYLLLGFGLKAFIPYQIVNTYHTYFTRAEGNAEILVKDGEKSSVNYVKVEPGSSDSKYKTSYTGDLKSGYLYKMHEERKLKLFDDQTPIDIIDYRIDKIIDNIFENAKYSDRYFGGGSSSGSSSSSSSSVLCASFGDLKVNVTDYEGNVYATIPFEEYIMGVIYYEEGGTFATDNIEYQKAFVIAATSYVLSQNNYQQGMSEITVRSGTAAQGWCDVYKGCHQNTNGQQLYGDYSIAPGPNSSGIYDGYRVGSNNTGPLSESRISQIKSVMNSVSGIVRMDNNKILFTQYKTTGKVGTNTMNVKEGNSQGKSGFTYEQILDYWYTGTNVQLGAGANCGSSDGWKQGNSSWSNIPLGNSTYTIGSAGCLGTSVAILIQNSGTKINIPNFNPGTFVESLNQNNGFTSGGLFKWDGAWKNVAPNFEYYQQESLPASKSGKIERVRSLLDQGYYLAMCVKTDCGHWVAVTGVIGDNIQISDPGSSATTVWPTYNDISNDSTLNVAKFKKLD